MTAAHHDELKMTAELASACFGLAGTWLMARRYAREPIRALIFAMLWPFVFLRGGRARVRGFLREKVKLNEDVPDSPISMVLGLNCLFIAFFIQFVVVYLEATK